MVGGRAWKASSTGRLNDYCWLGEFDAGLSIKWTKKLATGCVKDGWKALRNAYVPIVVQAVDSDDMTQAGKSLSTGARFKTNSDVWKMP